MEEKKKVSREDYKKWLKKYKELEKWKNSLKKVTSLEEEKLDKMFAFLLREVDQIIEKRVEEEKKEWEGNYEELRKENAKLKEKAVLESKACKELKKENQIFQETEKKYRGYLISRFLELQETLWEIDERDKTYEEFFNDSVLPLQILIGLDREMDLQTEERTDYYIWDVIIEPLVRVMKKRGGELQNGKLVLPKQEGVFEKEKIAKKIDQESVDQIERYIKEDERRVELKSIVLQKKQVVEELGRMLEELKELVQVHQISRRKINRLARETRILLERNGIYPMFAEELKEYPNSELKKRMIPVNSNSMKYPGLFIKRNGGLEVFGTNIGMDDCEEGTFG